MEGLAIAVAGVAAAAAVDLLDRYLRTKNQPPPPPPRSGRRAEVLAAIQRLRAKSPAVARSIEERTPPDR